MKARAFVLFVLIVSLTLLPSLVPAGARAFDITAPFTSSPLLPGSLASQPLSTSTPSLAYAGFLSGSQLVVASTLDRANVTVPMAPSLLPAVSASDTNWVQITPTTSPPPAFSPALAYDSARRRVVLFDGEDTWEYDGMTWIEKSTPASMPRRGGHAMVYDSARGRIVLFGGGGMNDTWEYDGTTWVEKNPATRPPARSQHAMAYDSARGRVVLFGGVSLDGTTLDDTWEYDGTNWIKRSPANHPYARTEHAMVYDSDRGRVILFGGANYERMYAFGDTWEYDGTTWVPKDTDVPAYLVNHAMAYDSNRRRVVLFGGNHPFATGHVFSNTWEYDGVDWVRIATTNSPPARINHAMAYDSTRGRVVLFGGATRSFMGTTLNDTWEYGLGGPTNDDFDYASLFPEPPPNGLANQVLNMDTNGATVAPDDPDMGCGTGVNSNTVWYKLVPSYYGLVRVSTYSTLPGASSNYDTVLAVFTGQRGSLHRITCNDDAPGHGFLSELTFEAEAGQTYYIEVADYNSGGGVLSLFVNYEVSPKAWTLMFYLAANNDLEETLLYGRQSLSSAARNLNVNTVVLWEGNFNSKYIVFTPWGGQVISKPDLNTGDPQTLRDFVTWAIQQYPANHYALIISNHGHGFSGTSVDFSSGRDWLTVKETSQALLGIYPAPDIIYMHACLMATLDSAYQLAPHAKYYVASESVAWAPIRYDYFITGMRARITEVPAIRSDTSPQELALAMAKSYVYQMKFTTQGKTPSTISVLDLSKITDVAVAASDLAGLLKNRMSTVKSTLNGIWQDVQRFDERGGPEITTEDRAADLYHFASLVRQRITDTDIQDAAQNLMNKISNAVLFNESWSGYPGGGNVYWYHGDAGEAQGISAFLPASKRECYYNGDWLDFASGTDWGCQGTTSISGASDSQAAATTFEWGPMLVEYLNQTNPSAPENWELPEPVPMLTFYQVHLPLVLREFGGTPAPTPTPPPSQPTIRIEPTSGPLGTRFNIYGTGFTPGETIQNWIIYPTGDRFDDPTPPTADSQGNFSSWVQPGGGSPTGTYTVYARGDQSQQTVSASFRITSQ